MLYYLLTQNLSEMNRKEWNQTFKMASDHRSSVNNLVLFKSAELADASTLVLNRASLKDKTVQMALYNGDSTEEWIFEKRGGNTCRVQFTNTLNAFFKLTINICI